MSKKLSRNDKIFAAISVVVFVVGSYIAGVHYGYSNDQILKVLIPLGFVATSIELVLKKNKKIDKSLELNEKERKSDSMLIWAGISALFVIVFIGFGLHLLDTLSKRGHEITLTHLILLLIAAPLAVFALYLAKRSKIKRLSNHPIKRTE